MEKLCHMFMNIRGPVLSVSSVPVELYIFMESQEETMNVQY